MASQQLRILPAAMILKVFILAVRTAAILWKSCTCGSTFSLVDRDEATELVGWIANVAASISLSNVSPPKREICEKTSLSRQLHPDQ